MSRHLGADTTEIDASRLSACTHSSHYAIAPKEVHESAIFGHCTRPSTLVNSLIAPQLQEIHESAIFGHCARPSNLVNRPT